MTCNDKAYGGVMSSLMSDTASSCYIPDRYKLTYQEKDSVWRSRALLWIREHPGRYAGLFALKAGGLFAEDSWADRPVLGGNGYLDNVARAGTDHRVSALSLSLFLRMRDLGSCGVDLRHFPKNQAPPTPPPCFSQLANLTQ
ncbi:MAG: hypothetical protein NC311_10965 [Muribaculaceae bacterium]|nr:hypothetical protein [Muribaculaceae bacterium]